MDRDEIHDPADPLLPKIVAPPPEIALFPAGHVATCTLEFAVSDGP